MDTASMAEVSSDVYRNKRIKHYRNSHRILLVGEGDFSFAVCLARAFGSANNMVATSLDSIGELMVKHPTAKANLETLLKLGCMVFHGVDVHTMKKHHYLGEMKFHRIVFNFPHAGLQFLEIEQNQINLHKELVKGFFISASAMLTGRGEIHISHKTSFPYNLWDVEDLAEEVGLILLEKAVFEKRDYPGYENKRAYGWNSNDSFPLRECVTFKFVLELDDDFEPDHAMLLAEAYIEKMERSKLFKARAQFI